MKITILTVGKAHDRTLADAIAEYQLRLQNQVKLQWVFISVSEKQQESAELLKRLRGYVILLDETGTMLTTPQFAEHLERLQNNSVKELMIVIGGSYGVSETVKNRADFVWSLSHLVFPHQLVRLILAEQLYRAYDLLAGGRYHHS
jgi:23S rRNA (pseudouridine1915-N3)-methyltransferase